MLGVEAEAEFHFSAVVGHCKPVLSILFIYLFFIYLFFYIFILYILYTKHCHIANPSSSSFKQFVSHNSLLHQLLQQS